MDTATSLLCEFQMKPMDKQVQKINTCRAFKKCHKRWIFINRIIPAHPVLKRATGNSGFLCKAPLAEPQIISAKLSGFEDHYKIKLKASGYRLVYEVVDAELIVYVIAAGKRERSVVYKKAKNR